MCEIYNLLLALGILSLRLLSKQTSQLGTVQPANPILAEHGAAHSPDGPHTSSSEAEACQSTLQTLAKPWAGHLPGDVSRRFQAAVQVKLCEPRIRVFPQLPCRKKKCLQIHFI